MTHYTHHWAHLATTTHREGLFGRNAGFIRQSDEPRGLLPDKSGVPVVVSRCARHYGRNLTVPPICYNGGCVRFLI